LVADSGHDVDDNVLLDREWTRVERETEQPAAGEDFRPETHDREGKQERDERANGDSREAEEEELIDTLSGSTHQCRKFRNFDK
jgi:hypothetical protein